MQIRIEALADGAGCTVWLGEQPIQFANEAQAHAYVEQLQARIQAAPTLFVDAAGADTAS